VSSRLQTSKVVIVIVLVLVLVLGFLPVAGRAFTVRGSPFAAIGVLGREA
jgi:hypothetical protein